MAERDQRMRDPPRSAAELENRGTRPGRVVHDGGFAPRGHPRVELDRAAVWRDHPRAAPGRLRWAGHPLILPLKLTRSRNEPACPRAALAHPAAGARPAAAAPAARLAAPPEGLLARCPAVLRRPSPDGTRPWCRPGS